MFGRRLDGLSRGLSFLGAFAHGFGKLAEALDGLCFLRCFAEGTPVAMADGTYKAIDKIAVGDKVLARNPSAGERGQIEAKTVTGRFVHVHPATVLLTFHSGETIEMTGEHPFYVQGEGFVPAGRLAIGNAIVTRAGPPDALVSIKRSDTPKTVYNIEVEGDHTYFVGNKDGGLWVHNIDCSNIPGSYINNRYKVDMRSAPASSATNAAGYPRNGPWFWRQLLGTNPELFDASNVTRIKRGLAPAINDQWIKYNPNHVSFRGGGLVHHHIDLGPIATPLPETVHRGWHGRLHY